MHTHNHEHHDHAQHPHRILIIAIVIILTFAIFEAVGGWMTGSLALLSDSGHMFSDSLALAIAAMASWIGLLPPSYKHSYGLGRAEVVAAWLSSLLMLIIAITVIIKAITRLHHPENIHGGAVMIIAGIGILVNFFVAWLLSRGERTLNIRAALLHVMSDILGSISALVSGAVIYFTHWMLIDPILSILIGVLIFISSLSLLRESLLVLMEGVPGHIDLKTVAAEMIKVPGVKAVHDLHIWTLSSGTIALSAHVYIYDVKSWQTVLTALMHLLKEHHEIDHVTLQPEPDIIDCQPCLEP